MASFEYSDRRPAPLASAAPGLLHPAITLRAHADAACWPSPPGHRPGGGPRGRGSSPRPSCRGASRGCPRGYHCRGDSRGRRPQGLKATRNQLRPLPKRRPRRQLQPPEPRRQPTPPRASPGVTFLEFATSAPSASPSLPSSKASPPSSVMPRLARPALSWPARETPAPASTTTGRALPLPPP